MNVRIACAASFPDDRVEAAAQIAQTCEVDYLLLTYLNEQALVEISRQKASGNSPGYVRQFLRALRQLSPALFLQPQLRVLTSAGALNPGKCAEDSARVLCEHGCEDLRVAVVSGDDLLDRIEELLRCGCTLDECERGERFRDLTVPPIFATAWLSADGVVEALGEGARLVIGGGLTSPVLTSAGAFHAHGWSSAVFDHVATAAAVGRCFQACSASQMALLRSTEQKFLAEPGCLLAEIDEQARVLLRRVAGVGGGLNVEAVLSDLNAPIHAADVTVDASTACVEPLPYDPGAVSISNVTGGPADDFYLATLGLIEGHEVTAHWWMRPSCESVHPEEILDVLKQRLQRSKARCREITCETLTAGVYVIRGWSDERKHAETLANELAWLVGVMQVEFRDSYLAKPRIRQRKRLWRTTVPKALVEPSMDCRPAREWV